MVLVSYGGGVFIWQKQKPHRRFGSGVWKALVNESKPDRRGAQQQRLKQQVQIQLTIHGVTDSLFYELGQTDFCPAPSWNSAKQGLFFGRFWGIR
jgi:hypothetical protein